MGVTTAIVAGSLLGAGASLYGSSKAASGAKKGAEAQAQYAMTAARENEKWIRNSLDVYKRSGETGFEAFNRLAKNTGKQYKQASFNVMKKAYGIASQARAAGRKGVEYAEEGYQRGLEHISPYQEAGQMGLDRYMSMLGLGPEAMTGDQVKELMQLDPGFQYRVEAGQEALERGIVAQRGAGLSGDLLTALNDYGQNMAYQGYNDLLNRYQGLAGMGADMSRFAAGLAQNAAGQKINSTLTASGQATSAAMGGLGMFANLQGMGLGAKADLKTMGIQSKLNAQQNKAMALQNIGAGYANAFGSAGQAYNQGYTNAGAAWGQGIMGAGSAISGGLGMYAGMNYGQPALGGAQSPSGYLSGSDLALTMPTNYANTPDTLGLTWGGTGTDSLGLKW